MDLRHKYIMKGDLLRISLASLEAFQVPTTRRIPMWEKLKFAIAFAVAFTSFSFGAICYFV
jgi:hypothetical protein